MVTAHQPDGGSDETLRTSRPLCARRRPALDGGRIRRERSRDRAQCGDDPLKDAKLNIEHNATDNDTGFQGFIDGEGWHRLDVRGPRGRVLSFEGRGSLATLGSTELFFETVEPTNADVPISAMLA